MKLRRVLVLVFTLAAALSTSCRRSYTYGPARGASRYSYAGGPGRYNLRMGNAIASGTVPAEMPSRGDAWGMRSVGGGPGGANKLQPGATQSPIPPSGANPRQGGAFGGPSGYSTSGD